MRLSSTGFTQQQSPEGREDRCLNSELWHACAGPLVSLPAIGSRVVYFPQGHSEQVAASTNKEVDAHTPNYNSLPPQLVCQLHNVTMHADVETDEVYAQMTLQPLSTEEQKDISFLPADLGAPSKQPTNYLCKTLTASDTSTHGGFSVPRRSAEKVFPPLDYSQQRPAQELIARDLHDNEWKFRHIFRGQPRRHILTTGWSVFVSAKRLVAGDSVLFIRNEKNQLLLETSIQDTPMEDSPVSSCSTVQSEFHVTIKANYEDGFIWIPLSASSGIDDLKQQVSHRLELMEGTYELNYLDEDNDPVLLTCDEDLQYYISSSIKRENYSSMVFIEPKRA